MRLVTEWREVVRRGRRASWLGGRRGVGGRRLVEAADHDHHGDLLVGVVAALRILRQHLAVVERVVDDSDDLHLEAR